MVNHTKQDTSPLQTSKTRLEKAFARLESALERKVIYANKSNKADTALIVAREEIYKLRQQNKLVSSRLDSVINHIKKILGLPGN